MSTKIDSRLTTHDSRSYSVLKRIKHSLGGYLWSLILPKSKRDFISKLPHSAKLLDVGCGNHSPENTKLLRPDLYYAGIDVGDYNTDEASKNAADEYILTSGENFAETIGNLPEEFDAAISSHNLEHCNHPMETIDAICSRLKKDGRLFLAFPCEMSVIFPSRKGTLNFYDDSTHINLPDFKAVMKRLIHDNRMSVDYVSYSYKPVLGWLLGMLWNIFEKDRVNRLIWCYYGFETIIWAHKK